MGPLAISLFLCLISFASPQHTAQEWRSRIIYHLLTDRFASDQHSESEPACTELSYWCGGNFGGIQQKLDYIADLGANAIWISPFVQQTPNGYHGYWAKNIYEVDPHWGTKQDLLDLIDACHERDIWVMMDVIPNHMGYPHDCSFFPNPPTCTPEKLLNFTGLTPFDQDEHYHAYCNTEDWNNITQVEQCRLANLPDLNQTVPYVRDTLLQWITNLTEEYKFDGYRVDTVKHIEINWWSEYQAAANNYLLGEVWNPDVAYMAKYQDHMDAVFNFALQDDMRKVFNWDEPMTVIANGLKNQRDGFRDTSVLGIFVDNHDMPRFLNYTQDLALFKNALALSIINDGIPLIYYGSEQAFNGGSDPECRESLWPHYNKEHELYQFISSLTHLRHDVIDELLAHTQTELYVDDSNLVINRGNYRVLLAVTKVGLGADDVSFEVEFDEDDDIEGREYVNIFDSDDRLTVDDHKMTISLTNGHPKAYVLEGDVIKPNNGANALGGCGTLSLLMLMVAAAWN